MNGDGLTKEQLYSTASYKNKDLRGVNFGGINLSGWDFSGQNLVGASLGLNGQAYNLNFTNADLRGTDLTIIVNVYYVVKNTIMNDGSIGNFSIGKLEFVLKFAT